jgi:hypothetical protein
MVSMSKMNFHIVHSLNPKGLIVCVFMKNIKGSSPPKITYGLNFASRHECSKLMAINRHRITIHLKKRLGMG